MPNALVFRIFDCFASVPGDLRWFRRRLSEWFNRCGSGRERRRRSCPDGHRTPTRSLVDQIVGAYLKQIGRERPVKPLERLAANTYGASIADAMIGKILTPENLTDVLNKGAIRVGGVDANMLSLTEIDTSKVLETLRRISPTKPVEFQIRLGQNDKDGGVSLHFEGNGWKLSGIQLPNAAVQALARSLMKSKAG